MEPDKTEGPSWLDKEFVETLLRDNENDDTIVVQDVTARSAVGKGENYASQLHRVAVNFTAGGKPEYRSLIVKSLPDAEMMVKFILEGGLFEREAKMYLETLPALYKLQAGSTDAAVPTFSARCYKTTRPNTIVLEDLTQVGYKMAARHSGLDLQHTKLALRAMARLHALSIGLVAQDPTTMDYFTEPFYKESNREQNEQFFKPAIALLAGFVEKWPGFERFGDKLRNIEWITLATELVKVREGGLTVLNHGDGWTNNMLFHYAENGEVERIKFVDFQISRYASPALDLQYFMHTSPNAEVREKHWDDVIDDYYMTLVETLKTIDCESMAFSFEKLKEEIKEKMMFGLMTACSILPIVLVDSDDAPEMGNISEENMDKMFEAANFGKTYNGTRFRGVFEKLLLHFESVGAI